VRPKAFRSRDAFRDWLEGNYDTATELLVRCFKSHSRERGVTYQEALDEALCFGWIDGVRRAIDEDTFSVRFTPRRPKSYWSTLNIRRADKLLQEGRMHAAGRAAFQSRDQKTQRYSFEHKPLRLQPDLEKKFRANRLAYDFFRIQAPWYRRTSIFWVMQAKREDTRARRLEELMTCCARGKPIKPLSQANLKPLP
jgi:uncharacterized protein YdeI (YjbR/CyaY-like superfamily)